MGKTSKALHIQIDRSLYDIDQALWTKLLDQGHTIEVLGSEAPDLILAPYAHRMTGDMIQQLPAALDLVMRGARALRYSPQAKEMGTWKTGKDKHAKAKKTRKRKDPTQQAETPGARELVSTTAGTGTGGNGRSNPTQPRAFTDHEGNSPTNNQS